MNDESNSKQTFKTTWICRLVAPSTYPVGVARKIIQIELQLLQKRLQGMHPDLEDSLVIRMEVEVVNPSPNATTTPLSPTKEQSSKKLTFASGPDMGVPAVCDHERWTDISFGRMQCMKCGIVRPYNVPHHSV